MAVPDVAVATIFNVDANLEWIFDAAPGLSRGRPKEIVGGAVFLDDDDNVLESSRWNGLGGRKHRVEEEQE